MVKSLRKATRTGWEAAQTSACLIFLLFLVKFIELGLSLSFAHLGILPRTWIGLRGILFSPLVHANSAHLVANSASLFVLLILLFWDKRYKAVETLTYIWLLSGAGTWIIGRYALHIGASSIVYGLAGYLIASAWWIRKWRQMLVGIIVALLYGSIFYGALPQDGIISWEGHLCGALAGWLMAKLHHG